MTLTAGPDLMVDLRTRLAPETRHHPWPTPGAMTQALDPTTVLTQALRFIDARLADVAEHSCERLIVSMPRRKSERTPRRVPV